jgi:choline kinase
VVGFQADRVREVAERHRPPGLALTFASNPDWHLENGISVLAAEPFISADRFAVLMGDHVFEPDVLRRLFDADVRAGESVLAVDPRPASPDVAAEATKVARTGSYITAIGKNLRRYDALDTGVFVCARPLFAALRMSRAGGDTTLSGGIRRLAARGLMRALEIGASTWCDIDTVSDLAAAEHALLATSVPDRVA